jgi:hypothetical protein
MGAFAVPIDYAGRPGSWPGRVTLIPASDSLPRLPVLSLPGVARFVLRTQGARRRPQARPRPRLGFLLGKTNVQDASL